MKTACSKQAEPTKRLRGLTGPPDRYHSKPLWVHSLRLAASTSYRRTPDRGPGQAPVSRGPDWIPPYPSTGQVCQARNDGPEQRFKVVIANEVKQSRIVALRLPRALRVLAMTGRIKRLRSLSLFLGDGPGQKAIPRGLPLGSSFAGRF
jgi:hypothetical protein